MSFFLQPGWTYGVFDGTKYRYLSIKSRVEKPAILFVHGFPSGPLTFQHIIPLFVREGYGIIVPELLGYGETDKPTNIEAYAYKNMARHLAMLLDHEGVRRVIVFGHDHGSPLSGAFVKLYPDRSIALILAAVGYYPPFKKPVDWREATEKNVALLGYENFSYWQFFVEDPEASSIMDAHAASLVSIMWSPEDVWITHFCPSGALKKNLMQNFDGPSVPWYGNDDKEVMVDYVKKTGFSGMLMWYKSAASHNNDIPEHKMNYRLELPYLFILTEKDPTVPPHFTSEHDELCDDMTVKRFNTGHWVIEEDPNGVVQAVLDWLNSKAF